MGSINEQRPRPLSVAQLGIWVAQLLDPQSPVYNIAEYLEILGPVEPEVFRRATHEVVAENDALFLRVLDTADGPRQYVDPSRDWVMPFLDVSGEADPRAAAEAWMHEEVNRAVDLTRGPMFALALFRAAPDRYFLYARSHHICNDGFGAAVFSQRLAAVYSAMISGEPLEREPLASFHELLDDEEEYRASARRAADRAYWLERLAGCPDPVTLSGKPPGRPGAFLHRKRLLSRAAAEALLAAGSPHGASLPQMLTAATAFYLHRLTGVRDLVLGIPVTARSGARMRRIVGMAANVLPLRLRIEPEISLGDLLQQVSRGLRELFRHQRYRREDLRQDLALGPDQPELYGTVVNVNSFAYELRFAGHPILVRNVGNRAVNDLQLVVFDRRDDSDIWIELFGKLSHYTEDELDSHLQRFLGLLDGLTPAALERPLRQLDILSPAERQALIHDYNATAREVTASTLPRLFEARVASDPDRVAVIDPAETLSYGELDRRANRIAHFLSRRGVEPGARVGLCLERSAELVVAMLGIVKAGAAYVPTEPGWPEARIEFICQDTGTTLLLTQSAVAAKLPGLAGRCVCLDGVDAIDVASMPARSPRAAVDPDSLAYIIFTSGSTGTPKGVALQHRPVVNLIDWVNRTYQVGVADRLLFVTSPCFDLSVYDVFGSLAAGASVYVASSSQVKDPEALLALVREAGITFWDSAPAFLQQLVPFLPETAERGAGLRLAFVSGDWIPLSLPGRLAQTFPDIHVVGLGGATEATIWSNRYDIEEVRPEWSSIPYGLPIQNARYYILDGELEPVPFGVAGDLYIGGRCLSFGYYNRPRLTAERFLPDPYAQEPGAVFYGTGDRARRMLDGNIEFLGRVDQQVKVRGFRIETGEIEAALQSHPAVEQVAVIAREDGPGDKYLVAYWVPAASEKPQESDLRSWLGRQLPDYMVPSAFIAMDYLPLTANGKLDRQALPSPDRQGRSYRAPRTREEEVLCNLFAELLSVGRVGIDDNFFALGGDSLLATRLVGQLRAVCGIELTMGAVFECPTVADLAGRVRADGHGLHPNRPELAPRERPERLPLSYAQERLWFIDQLQGGSTEYHIPDAFLIRGELDAEAVRLAIDAVVARHESLRTYFIVIDGQPYQVITPASSLTVPVTDLTGLDEGAREAAVAAALSSEWEEPFDLSRGPLLRVRLLKLGDREHLLLRTCHHIVSDGWSMGVFNDEFLALYAAFKAWRRPGRVIEDVLPPMPVQYVDFVLWQRAWLVGDTLDQGVEYWKEQLKGLPERLELPADRPRPQVQTYTAAACPSRLTPFQVAALEELSRRDPGTTLYMALLAAWATLLARHSGQDDIVVGSPSANRQEAELDRVIGLFVSTLALRVRMRPDQGFVNLLSLVRRTCLDAYLHQDVPFERLVDELSPERSLSYSPIFQVMFAMQSAPTGLPRVEGLEIEPVLGEDLRVRFDLELHTVPRDGGLDLFWVYKRDLFDRWRMEALARHFVQLIDAVLAAPERPLRQIDILSPAERQALIHDYNATAREVTASTLPRLFEARVASDPDRVAVIDPVETLSYGELDRRANRIAHFLSRRGVETGARVGLCLERSADLVVAMLGIVKAGAAYVPIERGWPEARIEFICQDTGTTLLLTQSSVAAKLPGLTGRCVCLDGIDISSLPARSPRAAVDPDSLAYIIFTSGSTGTPKGVALQHRPVVNLIDWVNRTYQVGAADRLLFVTSPCFDLSVYDVFGSLAAGASVYVASSSQVKDPEALLALVREAGITFWDSAPAFLQQLVPFLPETAERSASLRLAFVSGDWIPLSLPGRLAQTFPDIHVVGLGGATEAAIWSNRYDIEEVRPEWSSIPYGLPIQNARYYILDGELEPVPFGVPGDLYIGGRCLAFGYYNRPRLTAERFLPDPYAQEPGDVFYATGDRARRMLDGNIEFLGRVDQQVKVRGFRIETGEIEAALQSHPAVEQCAVIAREDGPGGKYLVAYWVAAANEKPEEADLRSWLGRQLPDYMVPSAFIPLDGLPLTANGKLDRQALPSPDRQGRSHRAPRTRDETVLCNLFAELLSVDRVGIDDNFFALGGDSIVSILLLSRAREAGLELSLRDVFQQQTVEGLAALARRSRPVSRPEEARAEAVGEVIPTPIMRWFLARGGPIKPFSQSVLLRLPGEVTGARLEEALQALLDTHDALRLRLERRPDGEWGLRIAPKGSVAAGDCLSRVDLDGIDEENWQEEVRAAARQAIGTLDPEAGRIVRAVWLSRAGSGSLLLTIHHLAVDGASWRILVPDLAAAWRAADRGEPLPAPAGTPFRVWARRLAEHARTVQAELPAWEVLLDGGTPLVPGVAFDPTRDTFATAGHLRVELSEAVTSSLLSTVPSAFHARVDDALLTAFSLAVAGWRRQRGAREEGPVLVDLESHGRAPLGEDIDLSRTVGWFTSMFPVGLDAGPIDIEEALAGGPDLGRAFKRVKEQSRSRGTGLGYGLLRHGPEAGSRLAGRAAAQVGFNYLGRTSTGSAGDWSPDMESVDFRRLQDPAAPLLHLLDVDAVTLDGPGGPRLVADWTWAGEVFEEADVRSLAELWRRTLEALACHVQPLAAGEPWRAVHLGGHTPSDFPLVKVSQDRVERLEAAFPELEDVLPLSPLQEGLLFHALYDETGPDFYTVQVTLELEGELDTARLRAALRGLLQRHPNLRAGFHHEGSERPVQVIRRQVEVPWREEDLSSLDRAAAGAWKAWLESERAARFTLAAPPLLRFLVLRIPGTGSGLARHLLVVTHHHILMDGWSLPIFLGELFTLYEDGEGIGRLARPRPYTDYLEWLARQDPQASLAVWRDYLAGVEGPTLLARPAERDALPAWPERWQAELPTEMTAGLVALARRSGLTLGNLIQGLWAVLTGRLTGRDDVVFGVTVSGRPAEVAGIEQMMGLFISTLPLRVRLRPADTLAALLAGIQESQARLLSFQHVGLSEIQRAAGNDELFDTLIVFENYPVDRSKLDELSAGLRLTRIEPDDATHYPVNLLVTPGERLHLRLQYDPARLDRAQVELIGGGFVRLLEGAPAGLDRPLRELSILAPEQRHALIDGHNATAREIAAASLPELFEARVARDPRAVAVIGPSLRAEGRELETLSYGQLNSRANQLAHHLIQRGVRVGDRVGLCLDRSVDMVVALLAILKTGAAYVPIEPHFPQARLDFICRDTGAGLLVTQGAVAGALPEWDGRCVLLDRLDLTALPAGNPGIDVDPDSLAYIIFTSGSTGTPKGVALQHRAVVNVIDWVNRTCQVGAGDRLLFVTSPCFDLSVYDVFGSLAAGASVYVASSSELRDPAALLEIVRTAGITFWDSAPAFLQQLVPYLSERPRPGASLRLVFVSGDWIPLSLPGSLRSEFPGVRVIGLGGATEAAIWSNWFDVEEVRPEWNSIPYGLPIQNARYYILDRELDPVPFGVPGDLYIGGRCLAFGYYNQSRLTAERFLPDPYAGAPGAVLYNTGDRAKRLPDGTIELLGRTDRQVKIRGFRIELGEIEAALRTHERVQQALVTVRGTGEQRKLQAYVTARYGEAEEQRGRSVQLDQWQRSFDSVYSEGSASDFNLVGWNSSYTGAPIVEEEMRSWVEETVARLRALAPRRVVEVGCGTGLLLTRLAPSCERYLGLDFSAEVLDQLRGYLDGRAGWSHVELRQGLAHELSFLADDSVDLVIVNSVAQYFPDVDYLLDVLAEALRVTGRGGHVFVGDVRSLPLLAAHHASVQLFRAAAGTALDDLRQRVLDAQRHEEELVIDPALFADLGRSGRKVARVEAALKAGAYDNEVNRFRYDVTITLGEREELEAPEVWLAWDEAGVWRQALEERLARQPASPVGVRGIPDGRAARWAAAARLLHDPERLPATVEELRAACERQAGEDPDAVFGLARRLGVGLCWQGFGAEGVYDAVFAPRWRRALDTSLEPLPRGHYRQYTNTPSRGLGDAELGRSLPDHLRRLLPEYMVPSSVMVLDAWPLTPNGKVDHLALPDPERHVQEYRPPRTPREQMLCQLFAEVLSLRRVGIDESFFELGGHSLLATRLIGRIRAALGVDLTIRSLFEAPTVLELAERLSLAASPEAAFERVLPLRERGSLPPLFCIHPVGGLSWAYAGLLHEIDPERPVYGLQASGILSPAAQPDSVEAMAADYVAAIRRVQPAGPYHLLGWSFGGLVAHAMACRLQREGAEVASLTLLDSYPLGDGDVMPAWNERQVLEGLVKALEFEPGEAGRGLDISAVLEAARRAGHVLGCLDEEQGGRFLGLLRDLRDLVPAFRPGRFDGDLLFFAATETEAVAIEWGSEVSPQAWAPHVSGRIELHEVRCAHTEMANPGPIREIGRLVNQHLQTRRSRLVPPAGPVRLEFLEAKRPQARRRAEALAEEREDVAVARRTRATG